MRVCQCGGIISQYDLTKGREAWKCKSCGRYEIFTRPLTDAQIIEVLGDEMDSSDATFIEFARGIEAAHGISEATEGQQ